MIKQISIIVLLLTSILASSQNSKPVVLVKGKVLNQRNMMPVDVDVRIVYEVLSTGKEAGIARIDPRDGKYQIILPYGKKYGYLAFAEGYYSVTKYFDATKLEKYTEITEQNLYLAPIRKNQIVRLNNIFFEKNTAKLKKESLLELDRFVSFLKTNKKIRIEISAHTDNSLEPNKSLVLSENRAATVYSYVISKGIKDKRLTNKGYGSSFPIGFNKSADGRAMNNRTEFKIISLSNKK